MGGRKEKTTKRQKLGITRLNSGLFAALYRLGRLVCHRFAWNTVEFRTAFELFFFFWSVPLRMNGFIGDGVMVCYFRARNFKPGVKQVMLSMYKNKNTGQKLFIFISQRGLICPQETSGYYTPCLCVPFVLNLLFFPLKALTPGPWQQSRPQFRPEPQQCHCQTPPWTRGHCGLGPPRRAAPRPGQGSRFPHSGVSPAPSRSG